MKRTEFSAALPVLREAAPGRADSGEKAGSDPEELSDPGALAFEMVLHGEPEPRALEGALRAAPWRQDPDEIALL